MKESSKETDKIITGIIALLIMLFGSIATAQELVKVEPDSISVKLDIIETGYYRVLIDGTPTTPSFSKRSKAEAKAKEKQSKSKQSKAIVNKDGSTWRPDGHDYDGAKEDEAKRKGQKSPHGYGSWRDGYDKHRKMLQQIAQGENTDGKRVVSIEEFHTQSGLPKRPELLYSSDSVLLSEVDIDESGLVYELFVDNWSWDGIIVTGWHSVRREMIERLAPGVQLFTMDEAIAEFFPNESP